jgi:hypothetical protein
VRPGTRSRNSSELSYLDGKKKKDQKDEVRAEQPEQENSEGGTE